MGPLPPIDWRFGTEQVFSIDNSSVPYRIQLGCQSFDLNQDHAVDLKDLSIYLRDPCCPGTNCMRPENLFFTPCEIVGG